MAKFVAQNPKNVASMRISSDLLRILAEEAVEADISRNELINQMIMFALANMDDSSDNK